MGEGVGVGPRLVVPYGCLLKLVLTRSKLFYAFNFFLVDDKNFTVPIVLRNLFRFHQSNMGPF